MTTKYKKFHTPEYRAWVTMRNRCNNANNKDYKNYGGRGIRCVGLDSFDTFLDYIGTRPQGMSLDRIETNGHYTPCNIRWARKTTQRRNSRGRQRSSSKYRGVHFNNRTKRWIAKIQPVVNGKKQRTIYLGAFEDERLAAKEYDNKASLLWGDDAMLNFKNKQPKETK